jgi:hypothetical protein
MHWPGKHTCRKGATDGEGGREGRGAEVYIEISMGTWNCPMTKVCEEGFVGEGFQPYGAGCRLRRTPVVKVSGDARTRDTSMTSHQACRRCALSKQIVL